MKDLLIDVITGSVEEIKLTTEEIEQREKDRLAWELEQSKPLPLTEIEKLRLETAQANAEMFEMMLMMSGGGL